MKKKTTKKKIERRNFKELAVAHVIQHFGGVNATARAIETSANTVQYWVESGRIPESSHRKLLGAMRARCPEVLRLAALGEVMGSGGS